jgi:hypothetical protein
MLCKIWGFHCSDYEECRLPVYKDPVRTSQETHYVSATQPSQLMLCKIWGFHSSDYEECRLLIYKDPVPTSQETPYAPATELSRLMLCKISGFHGGDYEKCRLLGCYDVWLLQVQPSEEHIASIIRVARIGDLGKTLKVTSNRNTQQHWSNFPQNGILHCHYSLYVSSSFSLMSFHLLILDTTRNLTLFILSPFFLFCYWFFISNINCDYSSEIFRLLFANISSHR